MRSFWNSRVALALTVLVLQGGTVSTQTVSDATPPRQTTDGFAVPQPAHHFEFPRDHGSHPEFKIEWWYITGHLFSGPNRRYGFQATFFRFAGPKRPGSSAQTNETSLFGQSELHLAHMALLDVSARKFSSQERLNREGWDAAANTEKLDVRNGNWSLRVTDSSDSSPGNTNLVLALRGSIQGDTAFALELRPAKPLVVFGKNGVSRKGADPTAASYYLTFPRLVVSGDVTVGGKSEKVTGEAWMDHEISSSQLGADQVGWDWASLQLKDGREIMTYRMRRKDGSTDPFSTLAWVDRTGRLTHLSSQEFTWTPRASWKSPKTGAIYPIEGQLRTRDPATGRSVTFLLEPLYSAQELNGTLGGVAYWEGACRVRDENGQEVGSAYVELTGYAGKMREQF